MDNEYKRIGNYCYKPTSKPLGQGASATVYKAHDVSENLKEVAVKVIRSEKFSEDEDLFLREIEVLYQIKGDHIVHLLDVKRTPNNFYIFTELCNGGDLGAILKNYGPVGEEKALEFIYQFSKAFNTINNLEIKNESGRKVVIMHRDIKPANIFFHDDVLKVADFGFAKMVDESSKNAKDYHSLLGTPLYMAPQLLNDEPYTSKCDIWSAGVLIYECIFGRLPWTGLNITNLYKNIRNQKLKFPEKISKNSKDLLKRMLQKDESKRISWKEIENHPAVKVAGKDWEARNAARLEKVSTAVVNSFTQIVAVGSSMGIQLEPQQLRIPFAGVPQRIGV